MLVLWINCCRNVYGAMAARMKSFFCSLMDGSAMPMRHPWMGMPLTGNIVIELVCFGAVHSDTQVT